MRLPFVPALGPYRYQGDVLDRCPARAFDFGNCYVVVVTGSFLNPCGHMLLNAGGCTGWYFHVAELRGFPRFMGAEGYRRFLRENGKRELSRVHVPLPDPGAAMARLEKLLENKWSWFVLPHNCVDFVEEVTRAGGSPAGLWSNCPTRQVFR
jgi:hypothetical protein